MDSTDSIQCFGGRHCPISIREDIRQQRLPLYDSLNPSILLKY